MRYEGVLERSLPQLARLGIASFPTPYARIWARRFIGRNRAARPWQGSRRHRRDTERLAGLDDPF